MERITVCCNSVDGDGAAKSKKKRRRKEDSRSFSADLQPSSCSEKVDSSKTLLKSACAGLAKKKRPFDPAQSDWSSYGLFGEISSDEEKRSLLAWIENGIEPSHYAHSVKEVKECSKIERISKCYSELNGITATLNPKFSIAHNVRNDEKQEMTFSCEGHVPRSCVLEKDSLTEIQTENGGCFYQPSDANVDCSGKDSNFKLTSNGFLPHKNKRKRGVDRVLEYVNKRCIVIKTPSGALKGKPRTIQTVVAAWGRSIHVTLTSEACTIESWISSHDGYLFGLDVEWRPNRLKGQRNKVALLQLSNGEECLIVQVLFLDKQPQALRKLLADPSKRLAGVGVLADGKRLLQDYGLECQGNIELTALAVERLKREELRNVGLKVLMQEVLGLTLQKSKRVTLSNWAKERLDEAQINYACMDAWASFALAKKLLGTS